MLHWLCSSLQLTCALSIQLVDLVKPRTTPILTRFSEAEIKININQHQLNFFIATYQSVVRVRLCVDSKSSFHVHVHVHHSTKPHTGLVHASWCYVVLACLYVCDD